MSSALSKRQQARNEKALHDLVQNVPGNNMCADCHARSPAWASWSLGVFLCMRCAAIHRKLGTHISKVKSLSMDSWSNEQVDNMRKVGNAVSNRIYNAENRKPPVPVDADEADSAMERFIRQKYMNNVAISSTKPKSPSYDEDVPPPLPPKNSTTSSKFGLRSATSLLPLSRSKKDKSLPPTVEQHRPSSHGSAGKASRVFGASVNFDDADDMDRKLGRLRDMGFYDTQRNALVLKGLNGNLEQAVESLVRLGEGDKNSYAPPPPPRDSPPRSRSLTPLSSGTGNGQATGLSVRRQPSQDHFPSPSSSSTNPFDSMSRPGLQPAQSTGNLLNNNPYNQSSNPFGQPAHSDDYFAQAFQNMNISANQRPHQPLFPNRTGGLTPQLADHSNPPPMPRPAVPSAPSTPQIYQNMNFHSMTYPQPTPLQQQPTGYNPFLPNSAGVTQQQQQHQPLPQGLALNTQQSQPVSANNPFNRSPSQMVSPTGLGQIPEQHQPMTQGMQPQMTGTNPFFASPVQTPTQAPPAQNYFQQGYPQPQRFDKASIMALYGSSPAVPRTMSSSEEKQAPAMMTIPENHTAQVRPAAESGSPAPVPYQGVLAQPTPQANTNNPFLNGGPPTSPTDPFMARHISRESVNLGKDMAWTNGRHSPDAFASLSARHG